MRAGVWWGAALALLAVASALRTTQVEGEQRRGRRLQVTSAPEAKPLSVNQPEERPSFRLRNSRRLEENVPSETPRSRTRSRPSQQNESKAATETTSRASSQNERNERFDARRSRTRSKANESSDALIVSSTSKTQTARDRSRQIYRRVTTSQATPAPTPSSTPLDETRIEVVNANLDTLSQTSFKTNDSASSTFKRRSSTVESEEIIPSKRKRTRLSSRPNARSFNLDNSGVTTKFIDKEPTTAKSADIDDPRASRKLRYRTRLSETDSNLTGEGLKNINDVKSSQPEENIASQPDAPTTLPVVIDNTLQESTESSPSLPTTTKRNPTVRRPLTRNRINYNPKAKPKPKSSDEIGEEDNYPESFKALIQAKNASTQTSSPKSENLSVKASHTINKIHTPSAQSTKSVSNKTDRYRKSNNSQDKIEQDEDEKDSTSNTELDATKPKKFEYKRRTVYTPRARKNSSLESSTTATSIVSSQSTSRPAYKYNRKFKVSTTEATKIVDSNDKKIEPSISIPRKSLPKSSYYAPRRENKKSTENFETKETSRNEVVNAVTDAPIRKASVQRAFQFPRSRPKPNVVTTTTTTTEQPVTETTQGSAERKNEDTVDMPLIFTLLKSPKDFKDESTELQHMSTEAEENKEMFIIAVSSKESREKDTENEVTSKSDESEFSNINAFPASTKFHASYKGPSTTVADEITNATPTAPAIRNIQTRKYGRQRQRVRDYSDDGNNNLATSKLREKKLRKFSESQPVRTSETPSNVITPETDKPRSRFSSKYRAAYLDKPNYRPTVPTITSTNAWLKFFVTDRQLIKSVEEPNWFGEDYFDVTTEPTLRPNMSSHLFIYEPSIEMVEVEEIDLGPDMNAIGITKPRKTLSSADLKLSESLMKPSQVMNVEASNHSPSVTVSIFDALSDILTSTPKPRISSTTTAAPQTTTQNNNDAIQTSEGVSNNNNVNNTGDKIESLMSTTVDLNTNTKFVQNTDQTTPIVINSLSVGEGVTQSTISEEVDSSPQTISSSSSNPSTTIPTSVPTLVTSAPITSTFAPIPTTPKSARRPFAIKVLYSNTESSTDRSTTAPELISSHPSTDNPKMVYNTVSDLILSNNNLVSSDLTSMLSNNIRDILHNMDEKTRSRVSLDMAKLLKALVPRALGGVVSDDVEISQNTTPYSLEDIKDTENIETDTENNQNTNVDQIVTAEPVNIVENETIISFNVNRPLVSVEVTNDTMSALSSLKPMVEVTTILSSGIDSSTSLPFTDVISITTSDNFDAASKGNTNNGITEYNSNNNVSLSQNDSQNNSEVVIQSRIQTNPKLSDSIMSIDSELPQIVSNQNPTQVSPLQYWVLNKKAKVLKMIEDLIQQHNTEIATAPTFTDLLNQQNNIPMSQRLTEIINTMTSTNKPDNFLDENSELNPNPLPLSNQILTTTRVSMGTITEATQFTAEVTSKPVNLSLRFGKNLDIDITVSEPAEINNNIDTTTAAFNDTIDGFNILSTENIDTTTAFATTEGKTELGTSSTATPGTETSTQMESTKSTDQQNTIPAGVSFASQSSPPKRDYVIFGILPNNTVVRKDPNDDPLETLTEASPYIVYGVLPNNTIIRKFPNGTRVPRLRQKIDILPISPWSLKNPYSPIHNNPAIVKPQFNPIRESISNNIETSNDKINNDTERLINDTVNNLQEMISSSVLNVKDSSSLGVTSVAIKPPSEKSTASHVLSLRTTTMLPSVDEILLNSISSAAREEIVISSMTSSTPEPTILTLDIDPETKQIRTEKPSTEDGKAVFKFIPIKEVAISQQKSNVLKLATTMSTINTEKTETQFKFNTSPSSTMLPSTQTQPQLTDEPKSTVPSTTSPPTTVPEPITNEKTVINIDSDISKSITQFNEEFTTSKNFGFNTNNPTTVSNEAHTAAAMTTEFLTTPASTSIAPTTTTAPTTITASLTTTNAPTTTKAPTTKTTTTAQTTIAATTTEVPTTLLPAITTTEQFTGSVVLQASDIENDLKKYQEDAKLLETLLQAGERNPKNLNVFSKTNLLSADNEKVTVKPPINTLSPERNEEAKLLQALLSATGQNQNVLTIPNIGGNLKINSGQRQSTTPSLEDDIRQFEEDTKLLKALLQATGQNPASFNLPTLDKFKPNTNKPITTTPIPLTSSVPTTTISTTSIAKDISKFQEDAKFLQALLQATGQNVNTANKPSVQGVASRVRIASNPMTTFIGSNPTTQMTVQPVFRATTPTTTIPTTTQAPVPSTTETLRTTTDNYKISTTFAPVTQKRRLQTTTSRNLDSTTYLTGRRVPIPRFTVTTEQPSTSTFSVQEDIEFLNNLKSVLQTNNNEDPESALANRVIALAVEKSLNEIQTGVKSNTNQLRNKMLTTTTTSTTTPPSTTTFQTTTAKEITPSIEEDLKQFQEDTKLLQALLKATGQDPSKFNIPSIPEIGNKNKPSFNNRVQADPTIKTDLSVLTDLLNVPSALNEPFESLANKPTVPTTPRPYGAKIASPNAISSQQDDGKLLNSLINVGGQETTTQRSKLAITGQSSDDALKSLINQKNQKGMVSEATQMPPALSTEFGNSNDALLAALLKEQGFGPTTASSLDEQLKLAALLNQVVVTPKARRTTTPPPPPPAPRRPILDGLAWLWQQWRETGAGPGPARPNRKPAPSPSYSSSTATSNRVNWFGSGPFVGSTDDKTTNRIPLEPPRAVSAGAQAGRGQLVSAAINVTRAFSQFLGAAIQGAAQTVQNVIRAGQRAASDVYTNGSGGSG